MPDSLRDGSLALGATRWQTIWRTILPNSIPGIATGSILALSRAIGEAAPLIIIGVAGFLTFNPASMFDRFTALPIQIYSYASRPQEEFIVLASALIVAAPRDSAGNELNRDLHPQQVPAALVTGDRKRGERRHDRTWNLAGSSGSGGRL